MSSDRGSSHTRIYRGALPIVLPVLLLLVTECQAKPAHAIQLDAVDTCLFTCDYCFKGDVLLQCANTCLQVDGQMGPVWQQTCPFFRKKPLFFL